MTDDQPAPVVDEQGVLHATAAQVRALADDDARSRREPSDAADPPALVAARAVAADVSASGHATRLALGGATARQELLVGPAGLVAAPAAAAGAVVLAPRRRVAVTLLRLVQLGPRPVPARQPVPGGWDEVEAAVAAHATFEAALGIAGERGVAVSVDLDWAGDAGATRVRAVDAVEGGVWRHDGTALVPCAPQDVLRALAVVQRLVAP